MPWRQMNHTFLLQKMLTSSSYTNRCNNTSILFWIHGPIMLAWLANWRLRWSLDCWRPSSSWRAWSRCGTSCCTCTLTRDSINTRILNWFVKLHPHTWRKQCLVHNTNRSYLLPLLVNALRGDGGVRIVSCQFDAIVLCDFLNFSLDGLDSFPLFIRLWKSWFELVVSCYQSLQIEKDVGERILASSTLLFPSPHSEIYDYPEISISEVKQDEKITNAKHFAVPGFPRCCVQWTCPEGPPWLPPSSCWMALLSWHTPGTAHQ